MQCSSQPRTCWMQFALDGKCFPHPQGLHSEIGQLTGFSKMLYEFLVYFVLIIKAWVCWPPWNHVKLSWSPHRTSLHWMSKLTSVEYTVFILILLLKAVTRETMYCSWLLCRPLCAFSLDAYFFRDKLKWNKPYLQKHVAAWMRILVTFLLAVSL